MFDVTLTDTNNIPQWNQRGNVWITDIYNKRTLSEKIHFILTSLRNRLKSEPFASFSSLFHSECNIISYLTTMYVYCVYPAMSKSTNQLLNCLKIVETSFVLIVFNGVICDVSAYTVTVSVCLSTYIRYQKSFIRSTTKKHWSLYDPL